MSCPSLVINTDPFPLTHTQTIPGSASGPPYTFFVIPFTLTLPVPPKGYAWCPNFEQIVTLEVDYSDIACLTGYADFAGVTLGFDGTPVFDSFGIHYPGCADRGGVSAATTVFSIDPPLGDLCSVSGHGHGLISGFAYDISSGVTSNFAANCDGFPGYIDWNSGKTINGWLYYAVPIYSITYTLTLTVHLSFRFNCCVWNQEIDSSALFWGFGSLLWKELETHANPFNLQDRWGRYHRTAIKDGGVVYWRSDFATAPGNDWQVDALEVTPTSSGDSDPRVIMDHRGILYLTFSRGGNVYESISYDDGASFGTATMILSGTHPTLSCGEDGDVVRAAYVDGGSGTHGAIHATIQHAGDLTPSAPFPFVDDTNTPLDAANDTFHIMRAYEGPGRWVLHVLINGESSTSDWWSADDCASWVRVA